MGTMERMNIRIDNGIFLLSAYARNAENAMGISKTTLKVERATSALTSPRERPEHLEHEKGRHLYLSIRFVDRLYTTTSDQRRVKGGSKSIT